MVRDYFHAEKIKTSHNGRPFILTVEEHPAQLIITLKKKIDGNSYY